MPTKVEAKPVWDHWLVMETVAGQGGASNFGSFPKGFNFGKGVGDHPINPLALIGRSSSLEMNYASVSAS